MTRVRTAWIPRAEVPRVKTREVSRVVTGMDELGALDGGQSLRRALEALPEEYGAWIVDQRRSDVGNATRSAARDGLMDEAGQACRRIAAGIELVAEDPEIRLAFQLANRAMAESARRRSPDRYGDGKVPKWHLFQLAFVLLNLPGLADEQCADRETIELIFFPTGGGKTEAYLGVIAVVLLLRRLRGRERPDGGLGVAVLLRYTLRLLTLDQLARAATLVCALEVLRRQDPERLGRVRFAVGLWVGKSATANTMSEVKLKILTYKNRAASSTASPFPLTLCPWCGAVLGPDSLQLDSLDEPREVIVGCSNFRCDFAAGRHPEGLPVLFVDEQLPRAAGLPPRHRRQARHDALARRSGHALRPRGPAHRPGRERPRARRRLGAPGAPRAGRRLSARLLAIRPRTRRREGHAEHRPKLSDFDLVRAADTTGGTLGGGMLGTFLYSAPEAMSAPQGAGVAADVYSLAMTAAFCLYGADLPYGVLRDAGSFLRKLPCSGSIQSVLGKAAAWEPEERFASVAEFAQALAEGVGEPEPAHPAPSRSEGEGTGLKILLESGLVDVSEAKRGETVLRAVERALPIEADDLQTLGLVAWALDYFPGRSRSPAERERGWSLKDAAVAPVRKRIPPPPLPETGDPDWAAIPGGSFVTGQLQAATRVILGDLRVPAAAGVCCVAAASGMTRAGRARRTGSSGTRAS